MLKALELTGFKSFADKTRFEFPPGITVVVGPNGSGKSNIVDALKWVLGEQSAKSLRGKEMSDVIFKGAGGRKVMNTAEATIVIDNSESRIAIDAPEVHVTRRVYRSGEGEYLINGEPCRLKDIRDMFRGTGVGADAYSLIEQGKVDRLLQASAKDRRAIFEEAAGISRFKAKKIEAQRRLDRVDQNLLRLSDIVDEVESRLRSVRSQAAKARRYREYSDRLQQLRTHVGRNDWRQLTEKLEATESELASWSEQTDALNAESERFEARVLELETEVTSIAELMRLTENQAARNREQIAGLESAVDHQRANAVDLEEEESRRREQLGALTGRAGDLQDRLKHTNSALQLAEQEYSRGSQKLAAIRTAQRESSDLLERLRTDIDKRREAHLQRMRESVQIGNRVSANESQLESLRETLHRCETRLAEFDVALKTSQSELDAVEGHEEELVTAHKSTAEALEKAEVDLDANRRLLARQQEEIAVLQGQISGVEQRINVLEDLERKLEGLSSGVKAMLAESRQQADGPYGVVLGLVADLLDTTVELAPLVDVALGPKAHYLVLEDNRLIELARRGEISPDGRVGLVGVNAPPLPRDVDRVDLSHQEGVIGRADRMVRAAAKHQPLIRSLLGNVWFVRDLDRALALSRTSPRQMRFVTSAAELVENDGAVIIGPRQTAGDLISRRTELKSLRQESGLLKRRMESARAELVRLQENINQQELQTRKLSDDHRRYQEQLSELQVTTRTMQDRCEQLQKQRGLADSERRGAVVQQEAAQLVWKDAQQRAAELEQAVAADETFIRDQEAKAERIESDYQRHGEEATTAQIDVAKSEQRLEGLRGQMNRYQEDQRERSRAIAEAKQLLQESRRRRGEAERTILLSSSQLAELYLAKEAFVRDVASEVGRREQLQEERSGINNSLQGVRRKLRKCQDNQHKLELTAGEMRHQRVTLAERLRDDYGIEISDLEGELGDEQLEEQEERSAIEDEIAKLRQRINGIGAVNMEALNELDDLESRYDALDSQYRDLTEAKESLERIIQKINSDSRRLFTETLEAIRVNFQSLYRKAFGGGKADIVLEEGVDVLEAGIDIIATPPGKPSFNNSLLSGGEKALTAVALLLAIFQFRPSPFCVLDEVDAPFDEANIGRFVDVLKEFLGWTRFVIVTHSKKTMTAATTLYGVTMQESGVSKQVSVRFEDVSEDGQIRKNATDEQGDAA